MGKLTAGYTYTDAELLSLYREALAHISQGQSYSIRGKVLTRVNLAEVMRMITWLEQRVEAGQGGLTVVTGRHSRR